jgi:hypothetical protein
MVECKQLKMNSHSYVILLNFGYFSPAVAQWFEFS